MSEERNDTLRLLKEKMPEDEIMSTIWQSGYEPDGLKFS